MQLPLSQLNISNLKWRSDLPEPGDVAPCLESVSRAVDKAPDSPVLKSCICLMACSSLDLTCSTQPANFKFEVPYNWSFEQALPPIDCDKLDMTLREGSSVNLGKQAMIKGLI